MTRVGWIAFAVVVGLGCVTTAHAGDRKDDKKKKKKKKDKEEDKAPTPDPVPPPEEEAPPPPPPPEEDTPWSKGVSAEQKEAAQRLLEEGNDLFVQNKHADALAKYQEAVAQWDHPAIRFNMVRALIALDRPLEAYESLEKTLAYGKDPLEEQVYSEAQNYQILLEGRIATIEISCKQDRVAVSLDGQPFLDCPGAKAQRLLPGPHVVVGKKEGFMTSTQDLMILSGATQPVEVTLQSIQQATRTRTRWATWKPWAVAGGGAALAGLGVLVNLQASNDMDQFESLVAQQCADDGCTADQVAEFSSFESRALLENKIAIGMMAVGGAVVITGVTMVILNRPQTYIPEDERPIVSPTLTPDGAGIALSGRF